VQQALGVAVELRSVSDSWRLDAELLLAHALQKPREYLYTWPQHEISGQALQKYQDSVTRRSKGEPLAYIVGSKQFWDFELEVNPSVLIPRPETELLVEQCLHFTGERSLDSLRVADLGTGSGAIAIALARTHAHWRIDAVDISDAALQVAAANAERLGAANINFRKGSWCQGLESNAYDLIVANPPYVASGDGHLQRGGLPFEPAMALVAPQQGLGDLLQIIRQSSGHLKKGSCWSMDTISS
jgi:release factor glutamine methyltransferase